MRAWRRAIVIVTCMLPITLCGCGGPSIMDRISSWASEKDVEQTYNNMMTTIADDTSIPMSQSTKAAQLNLTLAQEKLNNSTTITLNPLTWISAIRYDNVCFPWMKSSQDAKLKAAVSSAYADYELAKATDKIYQDAINGGDEEATKKKTVSQVKQYLPMIIIAVILVLIVIILLILMKSKGRKPAKRSGKPKPRSNSKRTGQLSVNYERLLKAACKTASVDYKTVLDSYGGDARHAYESVNYFVGTGLSGDDVMAKVRDETG